MKAIVVGLLLAGGLLLALVGMAAMSAWWVWWLYPAWAWFIVPLGFPAISPGHLWALFILARSRLPALDTPAQKPKESSDYWAYAMGVVVGPMVTWLILRELAKWVSR